MDYNKAIIVGRVTANPELRTTPGGQAVTTIGVATNRTWTTKDGQKQEDVEFHHVVIWGRQAEVASQYLAKGSLVLIEGRIATRSWEDKDGVTRRATEIVCENMQLGPRPDQSAKASPTAEPRKEEQDHEQLFPLGGDEEDSGRSMEQLPF
jgi:single-strand DNA-binding protein